MKNVRNYLMGGGSALTIAAFIMVAMPAVKANAQALDDLDQGIKQGPGKRVSLAPKSSFEVSTDETEILPDLKGVVIVDSPTEVKDSGAKASGVEVKAVEVPPSVAMAASPYVGQPVSLASLDRMTRDMVVAFRNAGMPVVNVVVPPQDVTSGTIQVIAVIGRLGEVTVKGDVADPEHYVEGFSLSQGEVIDEAAVVNHLRWKSRRQNRRLDAVYSPGKEYSLTDIEFDAYETKPWSVFFGADNSGPGVSGDYRFFAGFQLNDLFIAEDEFSYQFTTSEDGYNALGAHVVQYTLPVFDRTDFQITGAWVDSGNEDDFTSTDGSSRQVSGTFITQLSEFGGFYWDARYGFDYKRADNDFDFGGVEIYARSTEIGQFFGQLEGELVRGAHRANVFAGIWGSPGGIFGDNDDEVFNEARVGATADYTYYRAGIDYNYDFANRWSVNLEAEGQYTDDRLLYSEMMYIGGINSVRGFEENVLRGDRGYFASGELITPAWVYDAGTADIKLRGFGFFDVGGVSVAGRPSDSFEGSADIAGSGIGLYLSATSKENPTAGIFGEVSYGWKVSDSDLNTRDDDDGQWHFRVITRF